MLPAFGAAPRSGLALDFLSQKFCERICGKRRVLTHSSGALLYGDGLIGRSSLNGAEPPMQQARKVSAFCPGPVWRWPIGSRTRSEK